MKLLKPSVVFLALLFVQTECIRNGDTYSADKVEIDVSGYKLIEDIIDIILIIAAQAIKLLNVYKTDIERELVKIEKTAIDNLWDVVVDLLNEIEKDLNATYKAPIDCIKQHGSSLTGTVLNLTDQMTTCQIQVLTMRINVTLPILTHIYDTVEQLQSLTINVKKCGDAENVTACGNEISDRMVEAVTILLNELPEDIEEAGKLLADADIFAETCGQDATEQLEKNLDKVTSEISQWVSLLVMQVCSSTSRAIKDDDKDTGKADDDYFNIVLTALHLLEEVTEGVTKVALITLSSLKSTVKSLENFVVEFAKYEINQLGDNLFGQLDKLKKNASVVVDIISCTEDREADIKALLLVFLNKTGDCAVNRIDDVLDVLITVGEDIQNINDEVKNISSELDNCEEDSTASKCLLKLIESIEKATKELPAKISDDVEQAKKMVDELINYLYECEHDNYNKLEIEAQEIYIGIVECVEKQNITSQHRLLAYLHDVE
ncbi:hypothetical protein NQ315_003169 [Exocentrus adspersus]|uniref:Uncharacterized protein n=1 Tax=Exocentrus adspersus TaxID=1586481 RepID=A0AAV8W4Y2_9CUCU|nr:hypothetical protein NQ315_003169 [Exocentrus adspersus]